MSLNVSGHRFVRSRRRYVPPNFAEWRHVLDIAQVRPAHAFRNGTSSCRRSMGCDRTCMRHLCRCTASPRPSVS